MVSAKMTVISWGKVHEPVRNSFIDLRFLLPLSSNSPIGSGNGFAVPQFLKRQYGIQTKIGGIKRRKERHQTQGSIARGQS